MVGLLHPFGKPSLACGNSKTCRKGKSERTERFERASKHGHISSVLFIHLQLEKKQRPKASPRGLPPFSHRHPTRQLHLTCGSCKENHSTWKLSHFRYVLQTKTTRCDSTSNAWFLSQRQPCFLSPAPFPTTAAGPSVCVLLHRCAFARSEAAPWLQAEKLSWIKHGSQAQCMEARCIQLEI